MGARASRLRQSHDHQTPQSSQPKHPNRPKPKHGHQPQPPPRQLRPPPPPAADASAGMGRVLGRPMEDVRATYTFGRELGRGQFGVTYLATHKATGRRYACKSIAARKLAHKDDVEDVRREVQIMHHLTGHRNIVELRGAYEDRHSVNLVMELCEGGELFDRIIARGHYSERAAAALCREIVSVVHSCHSMGVMHRDLKPENFLFLNKSEDSPLKATDFGLSVFFKPVEWICWLNGQRKKAPTPEELAEMEARRERVKQNVEHIRVKEPTFESLCRKIQKLERLKVCHLSSIFAKLWPHGSSCFFPRFAIVPQYSQRSTLMHCQMAGRGMRGAGSTKESFFGNKCQNRTLCMEKLSLVLPEMPPYVPRQFGRCAVVGNSGDLLKTKFGDEIDSYDVVIRENGAPIQNYTEYVGTKSTFRLLNRGSAKALDKVVELDETKKEVLIVKTTIHDIMNQMIRELPITNPVYLMLGTSFGSSAKGTGLKALEFALSICDSVDMYGFTVDPGYKEWTRYFSESRKGHTPLHGRAYYQMMECLGLVKIHSPMRGDPGRVVKWLPTKDTIEAARVASEKLLKRPGAGTNGPLSTCTMIKKHEKGKAPNRSGLRDAAMSHLDYTKGATRYPLERVAGGGYLCMIMTDSTTAA